MPANPDFRDLFAAFNAARVKYLLVGGYALAFHGRPRFTRDLDVWLEPNAENAARAYAALEAFGAPLQDLRAGDLERPGLIFQIGVAPNRIDVLTAIDGLTFDNAWPDRQETRYSDQTVPVISRHHLILNKRATGRPQDLLDAEELEKG
jgi:hypothetical protein